MTGISQPGEIRPPAQEAPFVRSADRKHVFRRRADRLPQFAARPRGELCQMCKLRLAEASRARRTRVKIRYLEKDLELDPVADDLASLALVLLMAEENLLRNGSSLFFVPGEEAASAN